MSYLDEEYYKRQDDDEFIKIIEFIAQEAYRMAFIWQYPDDYSRIINLYRTVKDEISRFIGYAFNISLPIERIIKSVVSDIAENEPLLQLKQNIATHVSLWLDDDNCTEHSEQEIETYKNLRQGMYDTVEKLFNENQGFQCNIIHKYPVEMLLIDFKDNNVKDHLFSHHYNALAYFHGQKYRHVPVVDRNAVFEGFHKTGVYNEKLTDERIIIRERPYATYRSLANRAPYQIDFDKKSIQVPSNALSKRESQKEKIIDIDDPYWNEKLNLRINSEGVENVNLITGLNIKINLEESLSNNDLDEIVACLRSDLFLAQEQNLNARRLLVETEKEFIEICNTPSLLTEGLHRVKELFKNDILYSNSTKKEKEEIKVKNVSHAKNLLCGLIIMCKHFIGIDFKNGVVTVSRKKHNKIELKNNMEFLASKFLEDENLVDEHVKNKKLSDEGSDEYTGFSAGTIERGYKDIKKLMNSYLDDFQRGRVQFDKPLNITQRDKLRNKPDVSLDALHVDDRARAEAEINKKIKKGQLATIKAWHNGSYVISW